MAFGDQGKGGAKEKGGGRESDLFSLDAEQALLGAILFDGAVMDAVETLVRPQDFYDGVHALIYDELAAMRADGAHIGPITLDARLRDAPGYADLKGRDYLERIAGAVPSLSAAPDYARIVADYASRRGLYAAGEVLMARARDVRDKPAAIADDLDAAVADIFQTRIEARGRSAKEALTSWMERQAAREDGDGLVGHATGLKDLDAMLGGLRPGKTYILAGRPGMGKTTLLARLALNMARAGADGYGAGGVGFSTLEQEAEDLPVMWATDMMRDMRIRLPYESAERGLMTEREFEAFNACAREIADLPILIDDTPAASLAHIRRFARRCARGFRASGVPFRALIVDYLGLIRKNPALRGVDRVAEISQGLAALARELDVPVIVGCQLNRAVEGRDDKRPYLQDLRESGDIEQDAYAVLFVYREAYYHARAEPKASDVARRQDWELEGQRLQAEKPLEVIIAKNKRGATGTVKLWGEVETAAIRDKGYNPLDPFNDDEHHAMEAML